FLTPHQEQSSSSLASLNADDDDKSPDSKKQTPQRQRLHRALQRQQLLSNRLKYQKNGHRQRIAWQAPEIRRLVTWRLRNGWSWLEIAKHLPTQRRTNNDCYDKWRNLLTEFSNNLDALKAKYLVAHDEDFDKSDDDDDNDNTSSPSSSPTFTTTTVISILDEEEETEENDDEDDDDDIMIISYLEFYRMDHGELNAVGSEFSSSSSSSSSSSFSFSSSSSSSVATTTADYHPPRHCVIAPELVTKEAFHNLSPDALQQSNWSTDTNYQSFIHAVRQRTLKPSAQLKRTDLPTKDQQIRFYRSLWLECCTAWVENHPDEFDKDVLAEAAATYEAKNKSPLRWPNIHRQLCRQHISGILQSFFSGLNELVDEFVAPILPKLVNGSPIHKAFLTPRQEQSSSSLASLDDDDDKIHRALQRQQLLSSQLKYRKNGHRQRITWQAPGIHRLVTWHLCNGWSWLEIAKHLPTQCRTNNDCYDKWRNLLTEFSNNLDALKAKYLVAHDEDFDKSDDDDNDNTSFPSSPTSTTTTVISILDDEAVGEEEVGEEEVGEEEVGKEEVGEEDVGKEEVGEEEVGEEEVGEEEVGEEEVGEEEVGEEEVDKEEVGEEEVGKEEQGQRVPPRALECRSSTSPIWFGRDDYHEAGSRARVQTPTVPAEQPMILLLVCSTQRRKASAVARVLNDLPAKEIPCGRENDIIYGAIIMEEIKK
ncbi:X-linked retinitis pigmentosa GTPase regulator, partial [Balamuthia mandrillaris]